MKRLQQDGFVSIMVAMIIMMFVALIGLGFAFLANQNHTQNQNRVLNTQAFYAAESGVNDAVKYLSDQLATNGTLPANKTTCTDPLATPAGYNGDIGSANGQVGYTCVLFDSSPTSLEYTANGDPDTTNESIIVRLEASLGNANFRTVTIGWQEASGASKTFATNANHDLPQVSLNAGGTGNNLFLNTGILRTTLIPVYSLISRGDLSGPANKTQTLFLYPTNDNIANNKGNVNFLANTNVNNTDQGTFVDGHCNSSAQQKLPKYCNVTISGLDNPPGTKLFYLRLRALYRSATVTISATDTNNAPVKLINGQAVIDSTGKADDVLRRIQVRVPLNVNSDRPENAVETIDSLCKRLQVWPGGASVAAVTGVGKPSTCQPNPNLSL